jgi:hypothetical protein
MNSRTHTPITVEMAVPRNTGKYGRSGDGSVGRGLATGWTGELPRGKTFFTSPKCPNKLWGPPSLLFNLYRGILPRGLAAGALR